MFVIGITGGIGCGKSTVAEMCSQAGLKVLDADAISRDVTAADGEAIPEISENFGAGILNANGALDREKIAKMVFKDKKKLDLLSSIVHRYVVDCMKKQVEKLAQAKEKAIVLDVPIPVKHGFLDLCDQVWVVWADSDVRLDRLRRRGMSADEAKRRMYMQMTKEEYMRLADREIDNSSDLDSLREIVSNLLKQELEPRGIRINQPKDTRSQDTVLSADHLSNDDHEKGKAD